MGIKNIRRGLAVAVFAFILGQAVMAASPSAPVSLEAQWRTGEIGVEYEGVTIGNIVKIYARQYDEPYVMVDSFTATESSGRRIVKYEFENGQTVWYRITQTDPLTNIESAYSAEQKVTPPITAFIINWPEILIDLNEMLTNVLEGFFTPSQGAIDNLNGALDDVKDSLGVGAATNAGNTIINNINNIQSGMSPPMVTDDGNGTFTGGTNPNSPPFDTGTINDGNTGGGGSGVELEYPNPDSGTLEESGFRIPYGVDMNGNLLYVRIFTEEQMEKLKWFGVLYQIMEVTMWIFSSIGMIVKFVPKFKV